MAYLYLIKSIYKHIANIILNVESISSKIRNTPRVPTLTTIIQHSFGSPSHGREEKEIKRIQEKKMQNTYLILKVQLSFGGRVAKRNAYQ